MSKACKHESTTWGDWYEVPGVTHMIEGRQAKCDDCKIIVANQTRQGRKIDPPK